jgi:hypothetical protein
MLQIARDKKELNENGTEAVGKVCVGVHLMHKPPLWWQQVGDFQNFKDSQVISLPNRVVAADNVSIVYVQLEVNSMHTSGLLLSHTLVSSRSSPPKIWQIPECNSTFWDFILVHNKTNL